MSKLRKFVDIGINLTDQQFQGIYNGKKYHDSDISSVLRRAQESGVTEMLVTGSTLSSSRDAIEICKSYSEAFNPGTYGIKLFSTVGVHPCEAAEYEEEYKGNLSLIKELAIDGKTAGVVKAFGEFGLDYDRLHFSPADIQKTYFKNQLDIACEVGLPLFLHSRAAGNDFYNILRPYIDANRLPKGGVVHSFTGTLEEMGQLLDLGLYVGINGCSLKTQENLDVVKMLPLNRLLLETDGPWCEIKPTHASYKYLKPLAEPTKAVPTPPLLPYKSMKKQKFAEDSLVKGRCEPCAISLVADVVAGVKELSVDEVIYAVYQNAVQLFDL